MSVGSNTPNEEYKRALRHNCVFLCSVMKQKRVKFTLEQAKKAQRVVQL